MIFLVHVIETALPVFMTLALGMLLRCKKVISQEGVGALKSIVVNVTLPGVLFASFATADYSRESIAIPLVIYLLCIAALALGFAACKLLKIPGKAVPFLASGFEAGMLGYGLFTLLYKDVPTSNFAMVDLGQVLFVFTLYKILLMGKGGLKGVVREMITSPVLWAIAIGLIFGATGLFEALRPSGVAGILEACADFIAAPTGAVILLTIGYDLVPSEIRWRKTAVIVGMRVVIMGALLGAALLINRFILGGSIHIGALVLLFILPPPYVLPVFAEGGDERANISSSLSVLTLLSIALFALMTAIVG